MSRCAFKAQTRTVSDFSTGVFHWFSTGFSTGPNSFPLEILAREARFLMIMHTCAHESTILQLRGVFHWKITQLEVVFCSHIGADGHISVNGCIRGGGGIIVRVAASVRTAVFVRAAALYSAGGGMSADGRIRTGGRIIVRMAVLMRTAVFARPKCSATTKPFSSNVTRQDWVPDSNRRP